MAESLRTVKSEGEAGKQMIHEFRYKSKTPCAFREGVLMCPPASPALSKNVCSPFFRDRGNEAEERDRTSRH